MAGAVSRASSRDEGVAGRLETLEDRKLLSSGMGRTGVRWVWAGRARAAEMSVVPGGAAERVFRRRVAWVWVGE